MTKGAPASRWAAALSRSVKKPVDSMTTSTPSDFHGRSFGSRNCKTFSTLPSTEMPSSTGTISFGRIPSTESYFKRCAIVLMEPRSFTATISIGAFAAFTARKKLRPIRPKPLIPTRIGVCAIAHDISARINSVSLSTYLKMSRWVMRGRRPLAANHEPMASVTATDRCRPPVQPIAMVK